MGWVAGAAKNLVSPQESGDKEFILRQIGISKKLHHIREIILMNHEDCGAYGGRTTFSSAEEERKRHFEDMQRAASLIRKTHPDLTVKAVLATIDHAGKIEFKEQT